MQPVSAGRACCKPTTPGYSEEDFTYGLPAGAAGRYPARPAGMLPGRIGDGTVTEAFLRLPGTGN